MRAKYISKNNADAMLLAALMQLCHSSVSHFGLALQAQQLLHTSTEVGVFFVTGTLFASFRFVIVALTAFAEWASTIKTHVAVNMSGPLWRRFVRYVLWRAVLVDAVLAASR